MAVRDAARSSDSVEVEVEVEVERVAAALARAFVRRQLPDLPEPLLAFTDAAAPPDAFLVTHSVTVPVDTEQLRRIVDATIHRKRLTFDYASPWADGAGDATESAREVSPWLVHVHDGRAYLHAFCHDRQAQRCFQVALMSHVCIDDQPARERPRALRQRAEKAFGLAAASDRPLLTADVRLHGGWAQWVEHEVWHDQQSDRWDGDVLTRRFRFAHIDEAVRRLLPGGGEVEVVAPGELRAAFRAALRAGLERNSGDRFGRDVA